MSDTGPGADPRGSSTWDNPSWESSLADSSLSRPGEELPNPWSREGSQAGGTPEPGPTSAPSATPEPTVPYQPPPLGDPYATPGGYAGHPSSGQPRPEPPPPGFDPQPTPPYGAGNPASYGSPIPGYADPTPPYGAGNPASYGSPAPGYTDPAATYGTPPPTYGSNPYEVSPYQSAYGTSIPYGVVPPNHPRSSSAMVLGILGAVFGLSCGIGGLIGIGGIVQGRNARAEIDAHPGRYAGRSQAVAGIVTGTIGVVIAGLAVVAFVLFVLTGVATGGL